MRLPALSLAAVLLLSSFLVAQHSTPPSPPSPPPPPVPAAPAPSPAPAHSETPSVPSVPPSAPAMTHTATPATSTTWTSSQAPTPPAAHTSDANRVVPEQKIAADARIEGAPRIGDDDKHAEDAAAGDSIEKSLETNSLDKKGPKSSDSDRRPHVCEGKDCEKHPSKPALAESDLAARPCLKEPCPCPPGTGWSGHRCIATQEECPAGQTRSNGSCTVDDCAGLVSRAASIAQQARDARARMEQVCSQDPYGQECDDLKREHEALVTQYRSVYLSTPVNCRGRLPDPSTL
jgi:hypothetical protein